MSKRPIDVDEVWQNLIESWFHENISCDPKQQRRFFTSNLVQRTLAHVVGRGKNKSIPIEATEAGELKVAAVGSGLEDLDYTEHTAPNDDAIAVNATRTWSSLNIIIEDHPALIRLSPDGLRWTAEFTIKVGEAFEKDIVCNRLEIRNAGAGNDHTARIWGWY